MPPQEHRTLGRPMSEYFTKHPNAIFPQGRIPPIDYVKSVVIPQLENMFTPSDEACHYFSSILSLLCRPKELRNLEDTTLLNRCILALSFTHTSDPGGQKVTVTNITLDAFIDPRYSRFSAMSLAICASNRLFCSCMSGFSRAPTCSTPS